MCYKSCFYFCVRSMLPHRPHGCWGIEMSFKALATSGLFGPGSSGPGLHGWRTPFHATETSGIPAGGVDSLNCLLSAYTHLCTCCLSTSAHCDVGLGQAMELSSTETPKKRPLYGLRVLPMRFLYAVHPWLLAGLLPVPKHSFGLCLGLWLV